MAQVTRISWQTDLQASQPSVNNILCDCGIVEVASLSFKNVQRTQLTHSARCIQRERAALMGFYIACLQGEKTAQVNTVLTD